MREVHEAIIYPFSIIDSEIEYISTSTFNILLNDAWQSLP